MGRFARRLVGLVVVVGVGCSFDSEGTGAANPLAPSAGDDATASAGSDTDSGTGNDDASEGSTSSAEGSTSVGSDEACIDTCTPPVPSGWSGPFYVVDANDPIDCPAGFARQDLGFSGLHADPATCGCTCTETAGDCRVDFELSILPGCPTALVEDFLENGSCKDYNNTPEPIAANVRMVARQAGSPVSCTQDLATDSVPEPTWDSTKTFCDIPARGGTCGTGDCMAGSPEGYDTQMCISRDGDIDCPAGEWTTRTVVYRGLEDTRDCEGCSCSEASDCEVQAFAHENSTCGGTTQSVPLDACTSIEAPVAYSVSAIVNNGTCEASQLSDVAAVGQATPQDAVTLCCGP